MSNSQNRRLASQINIGLARIEAEAIDRAARQSGVSRAAFVRRLALAAVDVDGVTKAKRHRRLSSADLEAVSLLLSELGRTTGSAIQLSKALRQVGAQRHHSAVEAVLVDLRRQASMAANVVERLSAER